MNEKIPVPELVQKQLDELNPTPLPTHPVKDWHPHWMRRGARVWHDACGWRGVCLGFVKRKDSLYLEEAVILSDKTNDLVISGMTQAYDFKGYIEE